MQPDKTLFTIGEAAKALGVTRRMILNYEDHGLIEPDQKIGAVGNRYYTIDTLTKIRTIRIFQNLGLSLEEIRGYFQNDVDLITFIGRLEDLRDTLTRNIDQLYERTGRYANQIRELHLEAQVVYRRVLSSDTIEDKKLLLRNTALTAMRQYGTDLTRRFYFTEFPLAHPEQISFCVAVPPTSQGEGIVQIPPMRAICLYHHGSYEQLPAVRKKLLAYAQEQGLTPTGFCRHVYLEGPPQHKDRRHYITQVILPVEKSTL